MSNEIKKNTTEEVVGSLVDTGFAMLATTAGFPTLALVTPFAKGLILGLIENCYNDYAQRTLSVRETKKLNRVSEVALQTFREQAEKDGVVAWEMNMRLEYWDYAFEVAEHVTLESIRQSELKKVDVLGRYYGRQFYKGNGDWQDMHQMITMVGALTYRQIVLIRLISESFKGLDGKLFISNPSACVEINRLKDYGIWQTQGAAFGINESWAIQLDSIIPTIYSNRVCEALMLERLSEDDVKRAIDSLGLTEKGDPQQYLTEEDFKARTTWKEEGGALVLPGGRSFSKNEDDGQFLYDLAKGK